MANRKVKMAKDVGSGTEQSCDNMGHRAGLFTLSNSVVNRTSLVLYREKYMCTCAWMRKSAESFAEKIISWVEA
jgi:hypothetical protein